MNGGCLCAKTRSSFRRGPLGHAEVSFASQHDAARASKGHAYCSLVLALIAVIFSGQFVAADPIDPSICELVPVDPCIYYYGPFMDPFVCICEPLGGVAGPIYGTIHVWRIESDDFVGPIWDCCRCDGIWWGASCDVPIYVCSGTVLHFYHEPKDKDYAVGPAGPCEWRNPVQPDGILPPEWELFGDAGQEEPLPPEYQLPCNYRCKAVKKGLFTVRVSVWDMAMCEGDDIDYSGDTRVRVDCGDGRMTLEPDELCPGEMAKATVKFCGDLSEDQTEDVFTFEGDEGEVEKVRAWREGTPSNPTFYCLIRATEKPTGDGKVTVVATHPLDTACKMREPLEVLGARDLKDDPNDGGNRGENCCGNTGGGVGSGYAVLGSVDVRINVGTLPDGRSAGTLWLLSERGGYELGKRSSLHFPMTANGLDVIEDNLALRQIQTPGILADIVDVHLDDNYGEEPDGEGDVYEIRFYRAPADYGWPKDGDFYVPPADWPFIIWRVQNQGAPFEGNELTVSKYLVDTGTGTETLQTSYQYTYTELVPDTHWTWELTTDDDGQGAERYEVVEWEEVQTDVWMRTYEAQTYTAGGYHTTRYIVETWEGAFDDKRPIQRAVSYDGDPQHTLDTDYYYYGTGTGLEEGRLGLIVYPDGSWVGYRHTFDANDDLLTLTEIRGWKDEAVPADLDAFVTNYTAESPGVTAVVTTYFTDETKTHDVERGRVASVIEYADSYGVARTEYSYFYVAGDPDVLKIWTKRYFEYPEPLDHLRTITWLDLDHDERIMAVCYPDDRFDQYDYEELGSLDDNTTSPQYDPDPGTAGTYSRTLISHGYSFNDGATVTYPAGEAAQETLVFDSAGNRVLEETYVSAGGADPATAFPSSRRVAWTLREYDDNGRETGVYHSNGTHAETDWSDFDCCGSRIVTDTAGVATKYTYDGLGRLTETIQNYDGGALSGSDITTNFYYEYDAGQSQRIVRTVVNESGATPLESTQQYDLAGRLVSETDAADLTTTNQYGTTPEGGRLVTITRPDNGTEIASYYCDGRIKSVGGTGVVARAYVYEAADGFQTTYVLDGTTTPDPASWNRKTSTKYDRLGRIYVEERPSYPNASPPITTITTTYYYNDDTGRLDKVTRTAQPTTYYEYVDNMDYVVRSGLNLNGVAGFQADSTDRFTETETKYVDDLGDGKWWRETKTTAYATDNTDQDKVITYQRERLTGYPTFAAPSELLTRKVERHVEYIRDGAVVATEITTSETRTTWDDATVEQTTVEPDTSTPIVSTSENGLLRSVTTKSGITHTYDYDDFGRQTDMTDGRGNMTTTNFNALGQVEWVQNQHGDQTTYAYFGDGVPGAGQVMSVMNPGGKMTYYGYEQHGRMEKSWGEVPQPVLIEYDDFGQRWKLTTFRGTDDFTGPTWPGKTHDDGDTTIWHYDTATGLLDEKEYADGEQVDYFYKEYGKLWFRVWARSSSTRYDYNMATGEISSINYSDTPTIDPDIEFTYTRLGQLASVTDNRTDATDHTFDYTQWPQQISEQITGLFSKTITRTMDPTAGSRLTGLDIGADYDADYEYDPASGRMSRVIGPGLPAQGAVYGYMESSGPVTPEADLVTKIDFMSDPSTTIARITRQYEAQRDLIDYVQNVWDPDGTQVEQSKYDYTNDSRARRTEVTYTGAAFVSPPILQTFTYNERNELITSARTGGGWSYGYDNIGNRETYTRNPWPTASYGANALNQYTLAEQPTSGTPLVGSYEYDADGNLTAAWAAGDMNCDDIVDFFDVDAFTLAITDPATYEATYPDCNILNADCNGDGVVDFFDVDAFVPLITSGNDAPALTYEWDAENRLVEIRPTLPDISDPKVEFAYDYVGRRVRKQVRPWNGSDWGDPVVDRKYVWSSWLLLMELDGLNSDAVVRKYAWGLDLAGQNGSINSLEGAGGIGGLLAAYDTAGTPITGDDRTFVYYYDANGNVGQLVETTAGGSYGTLAVKYEYDPYGNRLGDAAGGEYEQPFRFSTKQFDAEVTELYYFGYRYYSPGLGRWMSRDPIGEQGGMNLFAYVSNAPALAYDAVGLFSPDDVIGWMPILPGCDFFSGIRNEVADAMSAWYANYLRNPPDRSRACCVYERTRTYGSLFTSESDVSVRTRTMRCPPGASDPGECCSCSSRSGGHWWSWWKDRSRVVFARWGACCCCTVKILRDDYTFTHSGNFHLLNPFFTHHVLAVDCGGSSDDWSVDFRTNDSIVPVAGTQQAEYENVVQSFKIPCDAASQLQKVVNLLYGANGTSTQTPQFMFPIRQCRNFAFAIADVANMFRDRSCEED